VKPVNVTPRARKCDAFIMRDAAAACTPISAPVPCRTEVPVYPWGYCIRWRLTEFREESL